MFLAGGFIAGCEEGKVTESSEKPTITIWEVKASSHSVEFMLTPVSASYYRYAVVKAADQSGQIDYITVNSTVTEIFTVDKLDPDTEYVIKAMAVNAAGETAQNQHAFISNPAPYATVENLTVFYNRITFDVASSNCTAIRYAIAPASGAEPPLEEFLNEETTGKISLLIGQLAADTEYKLYIYPLNAEGGQGDPVVLPIRTLVNVAVVAVESFEELSVGATFTLSLTGVTTLYYCSTFKGAPAPDAEDYKQKVIENDAETTTVTIDGLFSGVLYTAYFYGSNPGASSLVISEDFETVDNSINLSLHATANSYICTGLAEYRFNAMVKGNSTESVGTPASAKLLWTDKANIITSVTLDHQVVRFVLSGYGNGVIAVMDAQDKVLWSWHIYAPEEAITDDRYVNYHSTTYYVMDRNLGAMRSRSGTDCVLFQWGRKDPFPNVATAFKDGTGTAANFITVLWTPVLYTATGANTAENHY